MNYTPQDLERVWPLVVKALPALNGTHTASDIAGEILAGRLVLWPGERCFVLTEINQYPQKRELRVFLIGGDLAEAMSLDDQIAAYAVERGCDWVETTARMGFERRQVWKPLGYEPAYIVLRKELAHG